MSKNFNHKNLITAADKQCNVCGKEHLEIVIDLPDLPLTDTYCTEPPRDEIACFDQKLLHCVHCSHCQLANQINPSILYGDIYQFRTSVSQTARHGTELFIKYIDDISHQSSFSTVLDLGCNDLYLLNNIKHKTKKCIGIDPIWANREKEVNEKNFTVYGFNIEEIDLGNIIEESPDLILCRHTLEHIGNPKAVLEKLISVSADNALFIFEVPGFDTLLKKMRFDQVFHQHLQYFSLKSMMQLIKELNATFLGYRENYHDWGSFTIAFSKDRSAESRKKEIKLPDWDSSQIKKNYELFKLQMETANTILNNFKGERLYGYGAAQMLPILSYHMKNDFSDLISILDDDPAKDSLGYGNLPVKIEHPKHINDLEDATLLITAIDNVNPIMKKLLNIRPRHIIHPFHII